MSTRDPASNVTVAVVVLAAVAALLLFTSVALHAAAAGAAVDGRQLEAQLEEAQRRHDGLVVEVARLTSPERVRQEAERLGLGRPERLVHLQVDEG